MASGIILKPLIPPPHIIFLQCLIYDRAHEDGYCGKLISEFVSRYDEAMKSTTCKTLKDDFRTEEDGCKAVVLRAAEILDEIILREKNN